MKTRAANRSIDSEKIQRVFKVFDKNDDDRYNDECIIKDNVAF